MEPKEKKRKKPIETIKSPEHNIFEGDHSINNSTETFINQTKYHLSLPQAKFSNVSMKDRKWYRWYTDQLVKKRNEKNMAFEDRFKVCNTLTTITMLIWYIKKKDI